MFSQLALSGGDSIVYDLNTPGGYTLEDHWNSLTTQYKINQQPWDYVILQAQSQEPSLDSAFVTNWVLPYADALDSIIHLNDSCTQTVFYMTWGRKNGDASNCATHPPVCTFQGMQDQLRNRYLQMGYDNGAMVAPCGEAWRDVIATTPTFDLYTADQSHPSVHGSYLNACVFYASIFRRSPVGLSYYGGLPAADAQFLQLYAATCVLDSMPMWNTEVYYDNPDFTSTLVSGTTYSFTATIAGTNHQWNTGSGFVAGSDSITYTFPGNGTYLVTHVTDNGCHTDTSSQWITVGPIGIEEFSNGGFLLYPTVADDIVTALNPFVVTDITTVEIIDASGRTVARSLLNGDVLRMQTSQLANGSYLLSLSHEGDIRRQMFIVSHR